MNFLQALHPDLVKVFDDVTPSPSIETLVKNRQLVHYSELSLPTSVQVEEQFIKTPHNDALRLVIMRPVVKHSKRCFIFYHGGGMVLGCPDASLPFLTDVVLETGCSVILPQYRLAPEHPFPAAMHDCYDTLSWAYEQAGKIDIDEKLIAIGGASGRRRIMCSSKFVYTRSRGATDFISITALSHA